MLHCIAQLCTPLYFSKGGMIIFDDNSTPIPHNSTTDGDNNSEDGNLGFQVSKEGGI